jgi:hypothetical protein
MSLLIMILILSYQAPPLWTHLTLITSLEFIYQDTITLGVKATISATQFSPLHSLPQFNKTCLTELCTYKNTIWFLTRAKNIQEKRQPLPQWCWENWPSAGRKLKRDLHLSACTKTNSKCIKDLNIRSEPLKLPQENIRETVEDTGIGNCFLNKTGIAKKIRAELTNRNVSD